MTTDTMDSTTTADKDDVVKVLNGLIEVCKDGEYGFGECAEHARSPNLKATLSERSRGCASAAGQLQRRRDVWR